LPAPDALVPDDLALLLEAAQGAGAIARRHFRSGGPVRDKGGGQGPVTEADLAIDRYLHARLIGARPGWGWLSEESTALDDPARLAAETLFVVDPIDGTRAFLTGRPLFGTLIGLLHQGVPVLGLIDQPVLGERWIGVAGEGTTFNGRPVRARPCAAMAQAELGCTSPDIFDAATAPRFERARRAARRVSWGGDCYLYGLVALGLVDAVVEDTLKPWDWAALAPILEGAGGRMTDWAGNPLRLDTAKGDVVALGDAALLPEVVAALAA